MSQERIKWYAKFYFSIFYSKYNVMEMGFHVPFSLNILSEAFLTDALLKNINMESFYSIYW